MPRFIESRTWKLLRNVPTQYQRLVKEVLSLRQKIVLARQGIHFLRRCLDHRVVPKFISKKKLGDLFSGPRCDSKVLDIEMRLLRIALRTKRDNMFAMLNKCVSKEQFCAQYLEEHLWKRIVSGSISICDSIRSRVKTALQKKFDNLCSSTCDLKGGSSRTKADWISSKHEANTTSQGSLSKSRVTVLGGFPLSDCARSILEMGPSFSTSQSISTAVMRKVMCSLHELQDRLRYKARCDNGSLVAERERNVLNVPFPATFYKQQEPHVDSDASFRIFADETFKVLCRFQKQNTTSNISREQARGIKELRELIKSRATRLSVSDKGGEFVVIPRQLDCEITEHHLGDTSLYRPASVKEFQTQFRRLNRMWVSVARSAGLDSTFITRLKLESPCCPVSAHKDTQVFGCR